MGSAGHKHAEDTKLFSSVRCLLAVVIQEAHPPKYMPSQLPTTPHISPDSAEHLSTTAGIDNLFWISRTPNDLADPEVPFTVHQQQGQGRGAAAVETTASKEKLLRMCDYPAGHKEVVKVFPGPILYCIVDSRKVTAQRKAYF